MKKAIKQFLVDFYYRIYFYFKYYKIASFIWAIAHPVVLTSIDVLRGKFIGNVNLFGKKVDYFIFISLVGLIAKYFRDGVDVLYRRMKRAISYSTFKMESTLLSIASIGMSYDITFDTANAIIVLLFLYFFTKANLLLILINYFIFSLLMLFSSIPVSILIGAASLRIRGKDFSSLIYLIIDTLSFLLIPTSFSILYFIPEKYHFLLIFTPWTCIAEMFRQIYFFGISDKVLSLIFFSIITTLIYLAISLKVFSIAFEKSRKDGRIFKE